VGVVEDRAVDEALGVVDDMGLSSVVAGSVLDPESLRAPALGESPVSDFATACAASSVPQIPITVQLTM
jgi:hypothetical protein